MHVCGGYMPWSFLIMAFNLPHWQSWCNICYFRSILPSPGTTNVIQLSFFFLAFISISFAALVFASVIQILRSIPKDWAFQSPQAPSAMLAKTCHLLHCAGYQSRVNPNKNGVWIYRHPSWPLEWCLHWLILCKLIHEWSKRSLMFGGIASHITFNSSL